MSWLGGWLVWWHLALPGAAAPSAGELLARIERLQVVGTVLYVAAHPDDENTRLISWLSGERGLRTAYLSMTRGGGGQNLLGAEQAELLGVLRTGELLAARAIDGGEQRFTRARDFGYSKSAAEALAQWGHDEALDDVVRAIRELRPDVIVTRFAADGEGHGHHTASAQLAREAFVKAADPAYVTPGLAPWQAFRLLHNRSTWRMKEGEEIPEAWARVDVGTYDPRRGRSFGEIAADSRTMHKSQGFGSAPRVGPVLEYFTVTEGPALPADVFGGIQTSSDRLEGTGALKRALRAASRRFDPRAPHRVVGDLVRALQALQDVPDAGWREAKGAEIRDLIVACAGLWLRARAEVPAVSPGSELEVVLEAVLRADAAVDLTQVTAEGVQVEGERLRVGLPWEQAATVALAADAPLTQPHWLAKAPSPTRYAIAEPAWRTQPDTPPRLTATFSLRVEGEPIDVVVPVTFARTDPVRGEVAHEVEVLPPVTASLPSGTQLLTGRAPAMVALTLRAPAGPVEDGTLRLEVPAGYTVTPATVPLALDEAGAEQRVEVAVEASPEAAPGPLRAVVDVGGRAWSWSAPVIDYPHVPRRTVLRPAAMQLVPVELSRGGVTRVGYLPGSGDALPDALRAVGYAVEEIDEARVRDGLAEFDAVVLGIRAYNTRPGLPALHDALMTYVADGGTLIVQYNTSRRWSTLPEAIGPAPLEVGRGRVTDETAAVRWLVPAHPVLTQPNALTPADFDGWVQERGLYFVEEWDEAYTPLLAMADPGEEPQQGALLVAAHGEGQFVYTSLSFFRQLPAGVPGAYRLFANLLAGGRR